MKNDSNKTKEQLIAELDDLRNQSKKREEEHKATNQQLLANEQQLGATNQQLAANNQQLQATEQQLRANNQQLIASEHSLRESEEKLTTLFNAMTDIVFEMDYDGRYINIAPTSPELMFKPSDDTIGKTLHEVFPKSEADIFLEFIRKCLNENKTNIIEYPMVIDNKTRWFEGSATPKTKNSVLYIASDITERKQAEQALLESEEKYRELFRIFRTIADNMTDMLWAKDLHNNYIFVNQAMCRNLLIAKDTDEPLGKKDMFFAQRERNRHPHNPQWHTFGEICRDSDHVIIEEKSPKRFDEFGNVKGKFLYLDVHKSPLINEQGEMIGVVGSGRDVTIEKEIERQLKESEERFRVLYEDNPSTYLTVDARGIVQSVNVHGARELGYRAEELTGQSVLRVFHPADHKAVNEQLKNCLGHPGEVIRWELPKIRKDGSLLWMREAARAVTNTGGDPEVFIVCEDITERKRNEQIQNTIHQISNAVAISENPDEFIALVKNELGAIIDTSNFFVALYDEPTDSISLMHHEDKKDKFTSFPAGKTLTKYVIKTKKSLLATKDVKAKLEKSGEVEMVGDPSEVWLGLPLFAKGKVSGVIAVQSYDDEKAYNESDMRTLEIIAHQISISLERKKAEQELKLALEKAEESNRLKTAFLNNMSHEIRTPLNGITGFIGLLQDPDIDDEEKQHYFDIINKSSDRLIATVTDIIDISKIEAGLVKVSKTEVSVNKILDEQYSFFNHQAQSKGLKLKYSPTISDKDALIVTDQHKLEGILINLIKNAIKFTEQGEITFGCSLKKEKDIEVLEFYVKDTGIGIPANRTEAIFNRFEQADIEDIRVHQGSGLGLAIAKSYVEMLGGDISVKSKEGEGSTFTFSIPYTKQFVKESDAKENTNKEPQVSLSNLSVIIAEDDETSKLFFEAIFKNTFNKITYTKNGKETIDKCRENPETDLILMDIKMPGMNGYDATREIRKFNNDVVIIAQTAFGLTDDREKAIEAGCNDYISKPIQKEELEIIIMKHFKNYKKFNTN
ncbi:PAS domain S-box protein [Lentimicrobium sp. S6]|uniref:PAS domain S-box protein n=2 Tax=unclassified Lentimicrobium TaxID=2677434 RepID=UPI0015520AA1|nr:PAS domain S-box protein [Lentimicrobium sp. S6]NPD48153.1 PAS domain S-box protein [Lentimicrobium sp. S6]